MKLNVEVAGNNTRWQEDAACRGMNPELFFPWQEKVCQEVRDACARCPVRKECLDAAIANDEKYGFFGGTTAKDRGLMSLGVAEGTCSLDKHEFPENARMRRGKVYCFGCQQDRYDASPFFRIPPGGKCTNGHDWDTHHYITLGGQRKCRKCQRMRKSRHNAKLRAVRTHCSNNHLWNSDNVIKDSAGRPRCRLCFKANAEKSKARAAARRRRVAT